MRIFLTSLALAAMLLGAAPSFAETGLLKVEGAKAGKIKGDSKSNPDALEVVAIEYSMDIPRSASGVASGRRQHSPVVVTLRWSAAAPMLFNSAVAGDALKVIYSGESASAPSKPIHTLTLTGARIVSYKIVDRNGDADTVDPLVRVSFTFQRIELLTPEGNIIAADEVSGAL